MTDQQTPLLNAAEQAALNEAWSKTVTPYSQIKDSQGVTQTGQYDFAVGKLTPTIAPNGMYAIIGEFPVLAPKGFSFPFTRTLYVGTKKDLMAALPETRLKSPALQFLRNIAKANGLPANDQPDAQLCASLTGRTFGNHLVEGNEYIDKSGNKRRGLEFGRNVTPAGTIPAKLDNESSAVVPPHANGVDTTIAGASFE